MRKEAGVLLDTHVWVRYINAAPPIRKTAIRAIDEARENGTAFVSAISVWEIAHLVKKGRLDLPFGIERWVEQTLRLPGLQLLHLTPRIAIESVALPDDLNKDPSDRILVASARTESLTLITADKDILRFAKQNHLSVEKA